jgi:hypothetical protein
MEPHPFYIDPELGRDWRGQAYCATCGMPKRHPNHELPERPPEDVSERILGEGVANEEA